MPLIYPQRRQRTYGNPAAIAPFPGGGMGGYTPAPAYPRMSAAGAAAAPLMPTPAPEVTTNPRLTPFQLSVNNQRAREARSAATFAQGAPLPMAPVPTPAIQPTATPGMMPYAPPTPAPGMAQPATVPMGQQPPAAETPAPQMQYSGAHGVGPQAEQTAQAARAAFIQRQNETADAQDRGPGLGVNSYTNAQLQQDANQRANDAADNPNAKDQYYEAGAAERLARANQLIPAQAGRATEQGKGIATKTDETQKLLPGKIEQQGVKTTAIKQAGNAAEQRALTGKLAQEDKMLVEKLKTAEQKLRGENRLTESTRRQVINQKITDLNRRRHIAVSAGINTADKGGLNDQINEAINQLATPAQAPTTQPAAGAAPATQPSASALQATHVMPDGSKIALDPQKNEWVAVG